MTGKYRERAGLWCSKGIFGSLLLSIWLSVKGSRFYLDYAQSEKRHCAEPTLLSYVAPLNIIPGSSSLGLYCFSIKCLLSLATQCLAHYRHSQVCLPVNVSYSFIHSKNLAVVKFFFKRQNQTKRLLIKIFT